MNRREALGGLGACVAALAAGAFAAPGRSSRPNVALITVDDLHYGSLGVTGCSAPEISPHIDRLASEGLRFERAHVACAVCQPARSSLLTGRLPHNNGAMGFEPIRADVTTLTEALEEAGYLTAILSKVGHLAPPSKFRWDAVSTSEELRRGRDPERFRAAAAEVARRARREGRPFFLMANSEDPHRPFAGSEADLRRNSAAADPAPDPSRRYGPSEVEVPGFLPDLPGVRTELSQYYSSAHRADQTVGAVLDALEAEGCADDALVAFLSDNGMSFPFAKTNVYHYSTLTPLIVRWPGVVAPGSVDADHLVSSIDYMPTVLDALGLGAPARMDGRSFLPLLRGEAREGPERLLTEFHRTSANREYPMRAVRSGTLHYIWNPWSDGTTVFRNEAQSGLTMKAMAEAAKTDDAVEARVRLFLHRKPEELYDIADDPDCLRDRSGAARRAELAAMRAEMLGVLVETSDPLAEAYRRFLDA